MTFLTLLLFLFAVQSSNETSENEEMKQQDSCEAHNSYKEKLEIFPEELHPKARFLLDSYDLTKNSKLVESWMSPNISLESKLMTIYAGMPIVRSFQDLLRSSKYDCETRECTEVEKLVSHHHEEDHTHLFWWSDDIDLASKLMGDHDLFNLAARMMMRNDFRECRDFSYAMQSAGTFRRCAEFEEIVLHQDEVMFRVYLDVFWGVVLPQWEHFDKMTFWGATHAEADDHPFLWESVDSILKKLLKEPLSCGISDNTVIEEFLRLVHKMQTNGIKCFNKLGELIAENQGFIFDHFGRKDSP